MSFVDAGFILDTGEWDFADNNSFGEDGNESINRNSLGGASRGGDPTPEPSSILLVGAVFSSVAVYRMRKRRARQSNEVMAAE